MYYLAGAAFSLALGFPLAAPAVFGLVPAGAVPSEVWAAAASCEALRRRVVVVLGGSTGTVGVRTESGCLDGQTLWGEGLSVRQRLELRLRRVPNRTRRGIRGLPDGPADGRGKEEEDLGATGLDFR